MPITWNRIFVKWMIFWESITDKLKFCELGKEFNFVNIDSPWFSVAVMTETKDRVQSRSLFDLNGILSYAYSYDRQFSAVLKEF